MGVSCPSNFISTKPYGACIGQTVSVNLRVRRGDFESQHGNGFISGVPVTLLYVSQFVRSFCFRYVSVLISGRSNGLVLVCRCNVNTSVSELLEAKALGLGAFTDN